MTRKSKATLKAEELEKISQEVTPPVDNSMNNYMSELSKIQQRGRVEAGTIKVKEFTDHKNVSLWHKDGKQVGPLHPHTAKRIFERFWASGIHLVVDKPTEAQIAAYKSTKAYKTMRAEKDAIRMKRVTSKKKGVMEKYMMEIAKHTGQSIEKLNQIAPAPAGR